MLIACEQFVKLLDLVFSQNIGAMEFHKDHKIRLHKLLTTRRYCFRIFSTVAASSGGGNRI